MSEHEFGVDSTGVAASTDDEGFVTEETVYDDLKAEFNAESEDDIKWYVVPSRPNIELAFSTQIDFDLLKQWFKKATDRRKKEFNSLRLGHIVLSNQTRGIRVGGVEVTHEGEPITLVHPRLWDIFGAHSAEQAMKKVFKSEGFVITCGQQVIEDAGYGDFDMEEGDDSPLATG
jgi:hypothetical protein